MGLELRFSYFSRRLTEQTGTSTLKLRSRTTEETEIGNSACPKAFANLLSNLSEKNPSETLCISAFAKGRRTYGLQ